MDTVDELRGETREETARDYAMRGYIEEAAELLADGFAGFRSISVHMVSPENVKRLLAALRMRGIEAVSYADGAMDLVAAPQTVAEQQAAALMWAIHRVRSANAWDEPTLTDTPLPMSALVGGELS